jgi:hypothetical protein
MIRNKLNKVQNTDLDCDNHPYVTMVTWVIATAFSAVIEFHMDVGRTAHELGYSAHI